jgi:hypothetical protein
VRVEKDDEITVRVKGGVWPEEDVGPYFTMVTREPKSLLSVSFMNRLVAWCCITLHLVVQEVNGYHS